LTATCAGWEPVASFNSPGEFERFQSWISTFVDEGVASRMPVDADWRDANPLFEEWYRCNETGQVWRLLRPDPPSRGAFVPLDGRADG
jgi:hypothetical protein